MTVVSQNYRTDYEGNDVATGFAFDFRILADTDLLVVLRDEDGVETTLAQGTDYTVSGVGQQSGGQVELTVAPATGEHLTITRNPSDTQLIDIRNQSSVSRETIEEALDKRTMVSLKQQSEIDRAIKYPVTDTNTVVTLPSAANRALKTMGFDADGNVAAIDSITGGGAVSSAMLPVTTSATLAVGRATMGPWDDAVSTATNGTTARSFADRAEDMCSIFDFLSAAQIAEIQAGTAGADAICSDEIQAAVDSGRGRVFFPNGYYLLDKPILLKSDITPGFEFVGESRTSTLIGASAADIKQAPVSQNAFFINQSNAGAVSFKNLRFYGAGYTGRVFYAVEGGGSDGSTQAMFSGQIRDCWFSLGATNTGYFYGALNNYLVEGNTFETAKGGFYLVGAGNADIIFNNNVYYYCYDPFIDATADTNIKNLITVTNLHQYGTYRDAVIKVKNGTNWAISNIVVQQDNASPASPVPGLFDFTDCEDMQVSNFSIVANGGAIGQGILLSGVTGRFSNGVIDGAADGIAIKDTKANDLLFSNVVIKNSSLAAFRVVSGSPSGTIRCVNCDWSNSVAASIYHSVSCALDFTADHCRFYNGGYPTAGIGNRVFNLASSGYHVFYNCDIGRDTTDAQAGYFVEAAGTGELTLVNCRYSDTAPPTGYSTGTQVAREAVGGIGGRYRVYLGTAAPAAGTWKLGDRMVNSAPAVGQPKAWACTVAGTPGTWVSEGNL